MNAIFIKEELSKDNVRFADVVEKANVIQENRSDFLVHDVAKNLWMDTDGTLSFNYHGVEGAGMTTENMPANSWALSQLSVKLGMPSGYAEKCIDAHHADLAAENVNTWLTEQNGNKRKKSTDYLIRSYRDGIDAVLSSGYTVFDTTRILETVQRAINVDDYHIVGSYLSDERMHLRMIKDQMLNVPGEDLYPAIFINSSDVGRTALHITFGIWKKICTNGMCINKVGGVLYHQRHKGINEIDVETEIVERIKMVPDMITASEDIIKKARTEKIDLNDEKVFEKMVADIRRLSRVSEDQAKATLEMAKEKYSMTRWGIVNAMTEYAQKFELDDRLVIENAAGRLIA